MPTVSTQQLVTLQRQLGLPKVRLTKMPMRYPQGIGEGQMLLSSLARVIRRKSPLCYIYIQLHSCGSERY